MTLLKVKFKVGPKLTWTLTLPRRSERLKHQKEKEEPTSTSKCVAQTMTMPSSASTGALTDFTGSKWQKNITLNQRATPSGRTQEGSLLLMSSGQVLPLGRRPFLSSRLSPLPSLSAAGSGPSRCAEASTVIGSSCRPSPPPSCQGRLPERGPVPLSSEAPVFTPWKRPNGSGPPQVGQVCQDPTSLPRGPLSSCRFLSFPQSPTTGRPWSGEGTLSTPSPGQTLGKRSPTIAVLPMPSPRVSSRSATMNQSPGERVLGGQLLSGRPQCLAPHPGRDFPSPPLRKIRPAHSVKSRRHITKHCS